MKNRLFTKIGTGALALIMLFTFVACGNSNDDNNEEETESESIVSISDEDEEILEDTEDSFLTATYISQPDENGVYFESVIDDDIVTIYKLIDDSNVITDGDEVDNIDIEEDTDTDTIFIDVDTETGDVDVDFSDTDLTEEDLDDSGITVIQAEVFWVGSYNKRDNGAVMSGFTSQRDPDADMTYDGDKIRFTYYSDTNELNFTYQDENNEDVVIYMSLVTDTDDIVINNMQEDIFYTDDTEDIDTNATTNDNTDTENNEEASLDTDVATSENNNDSDENSSNSDNNNIESANATESADNNNSNATTTNNNSNSTNSDNTSNTTSSSSNVVSSNTKSTQNTSNSNSNSTCVHAYGQGTVTTKATCTTAGVRTYTCSKCGATKTDTIPATGHNYESSITKQATCGANGVRTYKCTTCGDSYTTTINATGNHNWQNVTEQVYIAEQGHYENGYVCNVCGYFATSSEEIANHVILEHNGQAWYSPSELVPGSSPYVIDTPAHYETVVTGQKCSVCGATK